MYVLNMNTCTQTNGYIRWASNVVDVLKCHFQQHSSHYFLYEAIETAMRSEEKREKKN